MNRPMMVAMLAVLLAAAGPVRGEDADREEARRYFEAGLALIMAENFEGAALSFEESVKLHPTMSGLFNLANCYKALERYDEALELLLRLRRDFEDRLSDQMRAESEAIEKEIRNLVGMLKIEVDRSGAAILVGGREVGVSPLVGMVLLAPGDHEVTAHLEGVEFGKETVRILPRREVTINLAGTDTAADESGSTPSTDGAPPDSAPSGLSPGWFWGGLAATAVFGGVTIGMAAAVDKASDDLPTNSDLNRAEGMQKTGIAFLALTGAAAVTTAVLAFFTDWGESPVPPGGHGAETGADEGASLSSLRSLRSLTSAPAFFATDTGAGLGISGRF